MPEALTAIIGSLVAFYAGMLVGGLLRDGKLEDAYAAGKAAGLRQAKHEREEADAEFDDWYREQERCV